jgi:hypothetical protein
MCSSEMFIPSTECNPGFCGGVALVASTFLPMGVADTLSSGYVGPVVSRLVWFLLVPLLTSGMSSSLSDWPAAPYFCVPYFLAFGKR